MLLEQDQATIEVVAGTAPVTLLDARPGARLTEGGSGLDIHEVVERILGSHWGLVLALALIGLAAGYGLHYRDRPMYAASARVVLDTPDAQAQSESQAYADGARAIVTSPSHVAAALRKIGVSRDAAQVASQDVTLQAVGTSAISTPCAL